MVDIQASKAKKQRNPNWTRDELILALDVYLSHADRLPGPTDSAVVELSALLNKLWASDVAVGGDTLRNVNGVSMKLGNFQRFDPKYAGQGLKGLPHGNRAEKEVWDEFASDLTHLKATAAAIRSAMLANVSLQVTEYPEEAEAAEGRVLTRLHHYRERDRGLVDKRKAQMLAATGALRCEVCQFDFKSRYGARGEGFIEAHHTKPLHTLEPGSRTKLSDLALICANLSVVRTFGAALGLD